MKKIILILISSLLVLSGCGKSVYEAEITYTVPEKPAQEGGAVTYETMFSGTYVIGQSPSEYVTGDEVEFTTSQTGTYIAGEDFPVGTYDIVAVDGNGDVSTDEVGGLSENMGTHSEYGYIGTYDNYTFVEGEMLEVSEVSVTLVPQTYDTYVIEPGTFDIIAIEGDGNVFSNEELNELMGIDDGGERYDARYEDYTFIEGEIFQVSEVKVQLVGELPAHDTIPAHDVVETLTYDSKDYGVRSTCTTDVSGEIETVDCNSLKYYDELEADIDSQMEE